jgi:hypothetical protein
MQRPPCGGLGYSVLESVEREYFRPIGELSSAQVGGQAIADLENSIHGAN